MDIEVYLEEFTADWRLAGRSAATAANYCHSVRTLVATTSDAKEVTLAGVKVWLAESVSAETARYRARAVRAFGRWALTHEGPQWTWWASVPLQATPAKPQPTVSLDEYRAAVASASQLRDRCVIELLWSTGMRVSELARVRVEHVDVRGGYISVPRTKTGRPRVVPLTDAALRACRRQINARTTGSLLGMSSHAIQLLLRRLGAPTPHAWRRGWAVHALRNGVSEASVRAAAGWSSGAMVARYTSAVTGE
ncbi:MAG: tyrosine-type recombinase/integrase [Ilumatobacteraceae bacterium]